MPDIPIHPDPEARAILERYAKRCGITVDEAVKKLYEAMKRRISEPEKQH